MAQELDQPRNRSLNGLGLAGRESGRRRTAAGIHHVQRFDIESPKRRERTLDPRPVEVQLFRRIDRSLTGRLTVAAHDLVPAAFQGRGDSFRLVDDDHAVGVQIVRQRSQAPAGGRSAVQLDDRSRRGAFTGGQDIDPIERLHRALGRQVKRPNRGDLVARKLNSHRVRVAVAKNVDDATADTERPDLGDHRLPLEAHSGEPSSEIL